MLGCWDFNFLPTNGFSTKPPKAKLLAGEQKATEERIQIPNPAGKRQANLRGGRGSCGQSGGGCGGIYGVRSAFFGFLEGVPSAGFAFHSFDGSPHLGMGQN